MAIDARIPMAGVPFTPGAAIMEGLAHARDGQFKEQANTRAEEKHQRDAESTELQSRIAEAELKANALKQQQASIDARNKQWAQSVAPAAYASLQMLNAGDTQGLEQFLTRRAAELEAQGMDPSDTLESLQDLKEGNVGVLRGKLNEAVAFGESHGVSLLKDTQNTDLQRKIDIVNEAFDPDDPERQRALLRLAGADKAGESSMKEVQDPNDPTRTMFVNAADADKFSPASNKVKEQTPTQKKEHGFYNTMVGASDAITDIFDQNPVFNPRPGTSTAGNRVARTLTGGLWDGPNSWKSGEYQRYQQAASQWTEAKLRSESGAAVPPEEVANGMVIYFPQYGDSPEVVRQKRLARSQVMASMRHKAGLPALNDPLKKLPPGTVDNFDGTYTVPGLDRPVRFKGK